MTAGTRPLLDRHRAAPRPIAALVVAALVLACGAGDERPDGFPRDSLPAPLACGAAERAVLTGEGIGALRIGASVASVRATCRILSDTIVPGPEGMPQRTVLVALRDARVAAVVTNDRIWRLHLRSPDIRTADSLGVASTLGALRSLPEGALYEGEGNVFFVPREPCGLSFRLARTGSTPAPLLAALPDSLSVVEVLVVGCQVAPVSRP